MTQQAPDALSVRDAAKLSKIPASETTRRYTMVAPAFISALLANTVFRTFITGSGFFADSYDLFVTDGVTNILKDLGPINSVSYTYALSSNSSATLTAYFNGLCDTTSNNAKGVGCLPYVFDYTQPGGWVPNPSTTFSPEMLPTYQAQTADLKNAVSNAALIGSILGQLFFGFAGDILGRKWCFFITSALIILGALGSASSAAGTVVPNCVPVQTGDVQLFGSNSCGPTSSANDVYLQLCIWRGLLGFGVGGEYPLASTIAGESSTMATRGRNVLMTFSMQGWGKLTAAVVNYALVSTLRVFGGPWALDATWRFALAFGCALNILTIYFRWHLDESAVFLRAKAAELQVAVAPPLPGIELTTLGDATVETPNPLAVLVPTLPAAALTGPSAALNPPHSAGGGSHIAPLSFRTTLRVLWEFKFTLIGTASTWFLIDVTFYGQSLMNTTVVNGAVTSTSGLNTISALRQSLLSTIYIMLIAIPGYWLAIAFVARMGRYWMTHMGFALSAMWFAVLAGGYNGTTGLGASGGAGAGFVIVYGLTYMFANFGPNSSTFLMAGEAFPTRIRATAHGISAACGKLGATAGSYGLLQNFNQFCTQTATGKAIDPALCTVGTTRQSQIAAGVVSVMAICAGISFLGNVMTLLFLRETGERELEDVDSSSRVLDDVAGRPASLLPRTTDGGWSTDPALPAILDWCKRRRLLETVAQWSK